MPRDARYDILFEPLKIGPVTTKNRFYQVPHCTGMGWVRPRMLAEMRGVKAEGGWGVVCTEYNSIHPASDDLPHPSASLWDDRDIRAGALMVDKVHEHGALAGAELWFGGARTANLNTREVSMDVASLPNRAGHPYQTRPMDKQDIRNFRRWHLKAAKRARAAGYDIVYVYATHGYLISNFLDPRMNARSDQYGGSLENRTRLLREIIEETKEAIGDTCAIAVRFSADDEIGENGVPIFGERHEMFEMLAEMPDLWDINIADYTVEMGVSRFVKEGSLEPYMAHIKSKTSKPVVTVGRFTSPDTMAGWVRRGLVDLIGAARPSIADPFLPKKIEEGRLDDIRECIGCNICYTGDGLSVPIRCTQNPTMGEEWRRGWHPEKMAPKDSNKSVLIVGAGPAGLEAARALGVRGYDVMLAEKGAELGGRVTLEATLPGLGEWIRVRDYRVQALRQMPNVQIFLGSEMTADTVWEVEPGHVAIACGASWRREAYDDGVFFPVAPDDVDVLTPDHILAGRLPQGPTLVYDTDGYYHGGAIAELLLGHGVPVIYATPNDTLARWGGYTVENGRVRAKLMRAGARIVPSHSLKAFDGSRATLECVYTGEILSLSAASLVMVSGRRPNDTLYRDILEAAGGDAAKLPFTLRKIGDCDAPAIIAAAVYAGHRLARETDAEIDLDQPLRHDRVDLGLD